MSPTILILFAAIGAVFGVFGSGGSMLILSVLIYGLGLTSSLAISYSFYVTGITSLVGFLSYRNKGFVHFKDSLPFAIPSTLTVGLVRYFIVPTIPSALFGVKKDTILLIAFAVLMLISSACMLLKKDHIECDIKHNKSNINASLAGIVVGFIAGVIGASGGFLTVPALHNFLKFKIKAAVGTSLLVISLNCLMAITLDIITKHQEVSIILLVPILLASIAGILFVIHFIPNINGKKTTNAFAIFTVIFSLFIIIKQLLLK